MRSSVPASVLSLTGKRWVHPSVIRPVDAVCTDLFLSRGIGQAEVCIPFTVYPDMPVAVERLRSAVARGETIGIFGDYDCDGITGTAVLVRYLRRQGCEPIVILPHRVHDGYGLKPGIVDRFHAQGVTLLLTVDTGVTAIEAVDHARTYGMDVIITDHHHLQEELPAALAILHPGLAPRHPDPHPSGAGVAFALVSALEGTETWTGRETDLALAAIGCIADLVVLRGGNRALVREGLIALNALEDGPLAILAQSIRSKDRPLTSTDIGYRLAPRINAAGRIEDPMIALRALLDGGEALHTLEELNMKRQDSTVALLADAYRLLGLDSPPSQEQITLLPPLLSLVHPSFPEGIIGLLAGRLTESFGRPSLVASLRDGVCTASLRSTAGYHITRGLTQCADLLQSFGGHAQAAGCSFAEAHFPSLIARLASDIREKVSAEELSPSLTVEAALVPSSISLSLCHRLQELEPFGQGNPEPLFLLQNVRLEQPRRVGTEGAHLQCRIAGMKAIGFRLGSFLQETEQPLDIVCKLQVDTWNGYRNPQVVIEDMRRTSR